MYLCILYVISLICPCLSYELPSIWKCSRIIPLHKGSNVLDLNNYRPIYIVSSVVNVFENLIYNQLSCYLNENNILSPFQSGFRLNHSSTTALLKLTNDILTSSNNSELNGAIFIDLTKAFDLVSHYILLD